MRVSPSETLASAALAFRWRNNADASLAIFPPGADKETSGEQGQEEQQHSDQPYGTQQRKPVGSIRLLLEDRPGQQGVMGCAT